MQKQQDNAEETARPGAYVCKRSPEVKQLVQEKAVIRTLASMVEVIPR